MSSHRGHPCSPPATKTLLCKLNILAYFPAPFQISHCSFLNLAGSTGSKMAVGKQMHVRPHAITVLLTVLSTRLFWTGFVYRMALYQSLVYGRALSCHDMYDWTGSNATVGSNWRITKGVPTIAPIYNSSDLKIYCSGWLNMGTLVVRNHFYSYGSVKGCVCHYYFYF